MAGAVAPARADDLVAARYGPVVAVPLESPDAIAAEVAAGTPLVVELPPIPGARTDDCGVADVSRAVEDALEDDGETTCW